MSKVIRLADRRPEPQGQTMFADWPDEMIEGEPVDHHALMSELRMSPNFEFVEAKHYNRKPRKADHCKILVLGISTGFGNSLALANYFADPKDTNGKQRCESANACVGRAGDVAMLAPPSAETYHTPRGTDWRGKGRINARSVGLTLCNRGWVREKTSKAPRFEGKSPGGWVKAVHPKSDAVRYWENFTARQMLAASQVIQIFQEALPALEFVCGREDFVRDEYGPGPVFPWAALDLESLGLTRMRKDWSTGLWFRTTPGRNEEQYL